MVQAVHFELHTVVHYTVLHTHTHTRKKRFCTIWQTIWRYDIPVWQEMGEHTHKRWSTRKVQEPGPMPDSMGAGNNGTRNRICLVPDRVYTRS